MDTKKPKDTSSNDGLLIICPKCRCRMGGLSKYCSQCGTKVEELILSAEERRDQRELCGKFSHAIQVVGGSRFCGICGKPIGYVH